MRKNIPTEIGRARVTLTSSGSGRRLTLRAEEKGGDSTAGRVRVLILSNPPA
jgi:hypothetical protein